MKRGFTLVEVVVALALSSILLALVGTSFYFITKLSTNVIDNSSNNYKLFSVRDYIISTKPSNEDIEVSNDGDVIIKGNTIVYDSQISDINIIDNKCTITYLVDNSEYVLSFILSWE